MVPQKFHITNPVQHGSTGSAAQEKKTQQIFNAGTDLKMPWLWKRVAQM
jgi:hypothetical protein